MIHCVDLDQGSPRDLSSITLRSILTSLGTPDLDGLRELIELPVSMV